MDFVRLRPTYTDSVEVTEPMQRWVAEIFLWAFAGGYQWTLGMTVRRARIVAE